MHLKIILSPLFDWIGTPFDVTMLRACIFPSNCWVDHNKSFYLDAYVMIVM